MKKIFEDLNGKLSSKRIIGTICIAISIVMMWCKIDSGALDTFIISSFGLVGLGVAEGLLNKIKK